jgi:hypothetical protein
LLTLRSVQPQPGSIAAARARTSARLKNRFIAFTSCQNADGGSIPHLHALNPGNQWKRFENIDRLFSIQAV